MSQEHVGYPYEFAKTDPVEDWYAIHDRKIVGQPYLFDEFNQDVREKVARWRLQFDPWCNGRYALAAMVWGLIFMLVISVMA